ncbi:EAL domain-containing protein (putative c-di-GMP-specific phosphodiesterase class I) [Pseudomonas sp. SJZ083]|nr:EAL domain-containing protein (putative c-di-GMP-specific phosphodiesterase class I) [Pseudomonas sp. SJZ083]TWC46081.1 EAL domain-containing protein (putative c-di-GMP-specific phosphodiesterase class I) [Pseudomonas sp. SJZ077]
MDSLSVLVLEDKSIQRGVLVNALKHLGVIDILQADSTERAMTKINRPGGVDIVLCDLRNTALNCLGFLHTVGQNGMVRAVALSSEVRPEMRRAVGQMTCFSKLQLLGELSQPMQPGSLQGVLHRYRHRRHSSAVDSSPLHKLPSEEDVRQGLASGDFKAWFQPKFEMTSGTVVGVEALARWEHPVRGLLLPKDFLAAVLAYDLIDEMFKQMLAQGISLLLALRDRGLGLQFGFNLHASQLTRNDLTDHILGRLKCHNFPGSTLLFEVAENGLLGAPRIAQDNLLRLRAMGCGLSIDGFGLGFSSLKLLCQSPFNQLKLAGQLVQDISDSRTRSMITSALALSRSLNMSLVIEGVSSQVIRDGVVEIGCSLGQGFHLAPPMDSGRLMQWLQNREMRNE